MSVNRFFQPGRSQRISQFVPNQLPADFLMKMAAAKQGRQDQARNLMVQQQLDFDATALLEPDKQYVAQKKQELDDFVSGNYNVDLTQPGKQAEILRYMSGLKKDKGLAAVAAHNKDYRRIKQEMVDLNKKGLLSNELMEESLKPLNEYIRLGAFDQNSDFSGISIPEMLDLHKKKESYVNDVKALTKEQLINANQFLQSHGRVNVGSSHNDVLMFAKTIGVTGEQIVNAANYALPDYAKSAEGQQDLMLYRNAVDNGRIDPNKVSPSDYLKNQIILTGMERVYSGTTFTGLSDLNKALADGSSAGFVQSPENTSLFGPASVFGIEDFSEMLDKEASFRKDPNTLHAAENLRNARARGIAQYSGTDAGKINIKLAKAELAKDAKKVNGLRINDPFQHKFWYHLNNPEEKGYLNHKSVHNEYEKLSNKDKLIYKNGVLSKINKIMEDEAIFNFSENDIVKKLSKEEKNVYDKVIKPHTNETQFIESLNTVKLNTFEPFTKGMSTYFTDMTLTTKSFKPKKVTGKNSAKEFTERLNTAKPGEFVTMGSYKDIDGNELSMEDIFKRAVDATIAVNPEGAGWVSATVNVGNKERDSFITVALSPKEKSENGTFMTMAKMIGEDFASDMRIGFLAEEIDLSQKFIKLPNVTYASGLEILKPNIKGTTSKDVGKFYLMGQTGEINDDAYKVLTYNDIAAVLKSGNATELPRYAQEIIGDKVSDIYRNAKYKNGTPIVQVDLELIKDNIVKNVSDLSNFKNGAVGVDTKYLLEKIDIQNPQEFLSKVQNLFNNPYIAKNKKELERIGLAVDKQFGLALNK